MNKVLKALKNNYPEFKNGAEIDQNLLACEMTLYLNAINLISFIYEYRESGTDSWIQIEYYSDKIKKTIIWDYDARYNFENIKVFAKTLEEYEKEIEEFENKLSLEK